MEIFVTRDAEKMGPFSESQIRGLLKGGALNNADLAWTAGQDDWIPLAEMLGLERSRSADKPRHRIRATVYWTLLAVWLVPLLVLLVLEVSHGRTPSATTVKRTGHAT